MKRLRRMPIKSQRRLFTTVFGALLLIQPVLSGQERSERISPIVRATQAAEPAVVNIQGNKTIRTESASFTSSGSAGLQQVNGMGSGVIIDSRGYIVTNLHVVQDVSKIEVTLADGTSAIGKLLNYDPTTDLALVKIDADKPLPVAVVGTSEDLMRGETVIAIGNPFGYGHTVTRGIVSALHRDVGVNGTQEYKNLIQTDASINPGNSGGPLLNIDGDMIGINVAVRMGAQGIGFAIPVDEALEVIADLVAHHGDSSVTHGMLTVTRHVNGRSRVEVLQVKSNSPADIAGVAPGDILLEVADRAVANRMDVELALVDHRPGDQLSVAFKRGDRQLSADLKLEGMAVLAESNHVEDEAWNLFGVRVTPIDRTQFAAQKTEYKAGLKISAVRPDSPASREGIIAGDVLVGILNWRTETMRDLKWILGNQDLTTIPTTKFYVVRGSKTLYGAMNLQGGIIR